MLIAMLTCGTASATDESAVIEDALKRAGGDTGLAMELLARDVVLFSGEVILLENDIEHRDNTILGLREYKEAVEPSFLKKLSDSTVFKVGLFILGVEVGRQMVLVK